MANPDQTTDPGASVFRELEKQNFAVRLALSRFRNRIAISRAHPTCYNPSLECPPERSFESRSPAHGSKSRRILTFLLLLVGSLAVAFTAGPSILTFLQAHWRTLALPLGAFCLGAGAGLLVSRVDRAPLRNIAPPDEESENPLLEFESLAKRTAARSRTAFNLQLWAVVIVGVVLIVLIVFSMVMVSMNQNLYASTFGSGGLAMVILTRWKWQPFDRINQARKLADDADTLGTAMRVRMNTIAEIPDPNERSIAEEKAVSAYLARS